MLIYTIILAFADKSKGPHTPKYTKNKQKHTTNEATHEKHVKTSKQPKSTPGGSYEKIYLRKEKIAGHTFFLASQKVPQN